MIDLSVKVGFVPIRSPLATGRTLRFWRGFHWTDGHYRPECMWQVDAVAGTCPRAQRALRRRWLDGRLNEAESEGPCAPP